MDINPSKIADCTKPNDKTPEQHQNQRQSKHGKLRTSQGILSINQIACKSTATEMRKCILHDSLPHLQIELSKDKKERKMMTRADTANCIQTPKIHKSMTKDSFSFQGPRIWNNLPTHLKDLRITDDTVKRNMSKWLLSDDSWIK